MKKGACGFTLVEILIVVGIIALIATIAIPNFLKARLSANETAAQATLKSISTAFETYAVANSNYPTTTTALIGQSPPYLNKDYFSGSINGYVYTSTLTAGSYSVVAAPVSDSTGRTTYTISTGAVLTSTP